MDVCCIFINVVQIIESIFEDKGIIFVFDINFGCYLVKKIGCDMVLWNGFCMVYEIFFGEKIIKLMLCYFEVKFIVYLECEVYILDKVDYIGFISGLFRYIQENEVIEFIVVIELGILYQM